MGEVGILITLDIMVRKAVRPFPGRISLGSVARSCLPGVLSFSRELARVIEFFINSVTSVKP